MPPWASSRLSQSWFSQPLCVLCPGPWLLWTGFVGLARVHQCLSCARDQKLKLIYSHKCFCFPHPASPSLATAAQRAVDLHCCRTERCWQIIVIFFFPILEPRCPFLQSCFVYGQPQRFPVQETLPRAFCLSLLNGPMVSAAVPLPAALPSALPPPPRICRGHQACRRPFFSPVFMKALNSVGPTIDPCECCSCPATAGLCTADRSPSSTAASSWKWLVLSGDSESW